MQVAGRSGQGADRAPPEHHLLPRLVPEQDVERRRAKPGDLPHGAVGVAHALPLAGVPLQAGSAAAGIGALPACLPLARAAYR